MYLGDDYRSESVSKYASPSREKDYRGLPPAFCYVGSCDPFCDENVQYIDNLKKAGVEAECIVLKGGYHAFEVNSPKAALSAKAREHYYKAYMHAIDYYRAPQKA